MTDESISDDGPWKCHPLASVDRIVVNRDDVIELMKREYHNPHNDRHHVFRLSPPFEGDMTAKKCVLEGYSHHPPDMDPKPVHIRPEAFIIGHMAGFNHSGWRSELSYPDWDAQLRQFRREFGTYDEYGGQRPVRAGEEKLWSKWRVASFERWKRRVRSELEERRGLIFTSLRSDVERTFIPVRFES